MVWMMWGLGWTVFCGRLVAGDLYPWRTGVLWLGVTRALQARCRRFEPVCAHGLVGLWCLVVCLVGGWLVSACPAECAGVGRSVVECCWFTGYRILGVSQGRSLPGKGVRQVYVREHTLDGCHVI